MTIKRYHYDHSKGSWVCTAGFGFFISAVDLSFLILLYCASIFGSTPLLNLCRLCKLIFDFLQQY